MNKIKIGELTIIYKEDNNINKIILMIKNNYDILINNIDNKKVICLFETDIPNTFSCPNIDNFIESLIKKEYLTETNIKSFKEEKFPFLAYKLYLLKLLNEELEENDTITLKTLIKFMSIRYFLDEEKEKELLDYLKYQDKSLEDEIINWYKEKERYHIYKDTLEGQLEFFPDKDKELINKIDLIFSNVKSLLQENLNKNEEITNRIYISREDLIMLFKKYLKSINAPSNWFTLFDDLINNNKLIKGERSICIKDTIEIDFNNTLDDLVKLAHEFAHLISHNKKDYNESSFVELPSIYHELNIQDYLTNIGFIENDAKYFYKYRIEGEQTNFLNTFIILHDIYKLKTDGDVSEERLFIEKYLTAKKMYEEGIKENLPSKEELKKELDTEIDFRTLLILDSPELVVTSYNYNLNLILAKIIMKKKEENPFIYDIMNEITIDFDKYQTLEELLNKIDNNKHNTYIKR